MNLWTMEEEKESESCVPVFRSLFGDDGRGFWITGMAGMDRGMRGDRSRFHISHFTFTFQLALLSCTRHW